MPTRQDAGAVKKFITPHECRLRDLTYSAPITVDVLYTRNGQKVRTRGLQIGRLPVMLRSNRSVVSWIRQAWFWLSSDVLIDAY